MKRIVKQGTIHTELLKKSGKEIISEESKNESIPAEILSIEPLGAVNFEVKRVVNMGNYEAVHITVGITLPCTEKQINKTYLKAKDFVELRLEAEVEELEKARQSNYLLDEDI